MSALHASWSTQGVVVPMAGDDQRSTAVRPFVKPDNDELYRRTSFLDLLSTVSVVVTASYTSFLTTCPTHSAICQRLR